MSSLETIPLQESFLFRKVFYTREKLLKHLAEYLQDEGTSIFVVQLEGHTPHIQAVSEDLRLINWIPAFEQGEDFREAHPIRLVAVHERDWFLEALSGAAAAIAIYEFIVKRLKGKFPNRKEIVKERARRTRTKYRTVMRQVTRTVGAQQFIQQVPHRVPYQEEYYEEVERVKTVKVKSVGNVEITEIDEVIRRIRRFEVYSREGEVRAAEFEGEK